MLRVATSLGISEISGIGLKAAAFIPAGTVIWRFDDDLDRTIGIGCHDHLGPWFLDCVRHYGFVPISGAFWVVCLDDARFMNHSGDPNTVVDPVTWLTAASRDIRAGEEITCDYRSFCHPSTSAFVRSLFDGSPQNPTGSGIGALASAVLRSP